MNKLLTFFYLPLFTGLFCNGCSTTGKTMSGLTESSIQSEASAQTLALPSKTITARGYGTVSRDQQFRLTPAQRKLIAIRASKMDALRELAEQVYGVRLRGNTTVEDMAIKNDNYRTYIDAFLRGAHVRNTLASGSDRDSYETVMELELTPSFYQCLFDSNVCETRTNAPAPQSAVQPMAFSSDAHASNCNTDDCYTYPKTTGFSNH